MTEPDKLPSLEELGSDIQKLREQTSVPPRSEPPQKGLGFALRVGVELMSGAFVGGVCGYYLDKWLGTSPVLFILCFILGSLGGFMTVMRILGNTKGAGNEED